MYIPVPNPKWKLGDPGTSFVTDGVPLHRKTIRNSDGKVVSESYSAKSVLIAKNQRDTSRSGQRILLAPGVYWRKSTTFFRVAMQIEWEPGSWTVKSSPYSYEYEGGGSTSNEWRNDGWPLWCTNDIVTWDDELKNRATTECLLKLNQGKVHYLTMLAEARRSVNMVADRFSDLCRTLLLAKRGKLRFGTFKNFTGAYLEYQYGWKPLVTDVYNAVYQMKDKMTATPHFLLSAVRTCRGTEQRTRAPGTYHVQGPTKRDESHTCQIFAKISDKYRAAAQNLGLNPLTTAWELVPYSFVVDWAYPVGNFLEAMTATAGLTFFDGYRNRVITCQNSGRTNPANFTGSPPSYTCTYGRFERTPLSSFPRPVPYFKSPFSSTHVTNAIALWHQVLGRR